MLFLLLLSLFRGPGGVGAFKSISPGGVLVSSSSATILTPSPRTPRTAAPFASPLLASSSLSTSKRLLAAASPTTLPSPPPGGNKVGVLLLNLGGPPCVGCVRPFLYNLFRDPDIIRLPRVLRALQKPIAWAIARSRSPKVIENYRSIGGGSPILKYTRDQAGALAQRLQRGALGNSNTSCYIAMRYFHPYTEQAVAEMKRDGVRTVVVLPLYPHFSLSTTGSSLRELARVMAKDSKTWGGVRKTLVPSWFKRPGYVSAMADIIKRELMKFRQNGDGGGLHVLFSAHGVPETYVTKQGDPYKGHIEESCKLIAREYEHSFPGVTTHLSFQSKVGPVKWLKPYTDDKLRELGKRGVKNLVVVPISFVSEHIETLEEIDLEYRDIARKAGISNWRRAPALNTKGAWLDDMAAAVTDAVIKPDRWLEDCPKQFRQGVPQV